MTRRTADETRRLLIDVGIEMLFERGASAGVNHIRLQDVLKRAGLTTGAAYRLWDNQGEYHRDLAVAATQWRDEIPLQGVVDAIRDTVERDGPLSEVVRHGTRSHIEGLAGLRRPASGPTVEGPPAFLTTLALRAATYDDPELQAASRARHHATIDMYEGLYRAMMVRYRRRLRPPFTVSHLAAVIAAMGEGFAIQTIEGEAHPALRHTVGGGEAGSGDEWTLFGLAVWAIVEAFTEPDEPGASVTR